MAAHSEDFVILACTVLIQSQSVMDGRTDTQTDRRLYDGEDELSLSAVVRKNYADYVTVANVRQVRSHIQHSQKLHTQKSRSSY